jgi:hypothetical protein
LFQFCGYETHWRLLVRMFNAVTECGIMPPYGTEGALGHDKRETPSFDPGHHKRKAQRFTTINPRHPFRSFPKTKKREALMPFGALQREKGAVLHFPN